MTLLSVSTVFYHTDNHHDSLATSNAQGELERIERALHLACYTTRGEKGRGNKGGVRDWARQNGVSETDARRLNATGEVLMRRYGAFSEAKANAEPFTKLADHLSTIHRAPDWTWEALCAALLKSHDMMHTVAAIIRDDAEVLAMWREAMKLPHANQHTCSVDNVNEAERSSGNSRSYTVSRLQRERPDLFAKVAAIDAQKKGRPCQGRRKTLRLDLPTP